MNDIDEKIEHFEERAELVPEVVGGPVQVSGNTPSDLLAVAVSQGADLAKLEKLMELQERFEANEARKAYTKAMAAFKKNPPEILKDAHVAYKAGGGTTEYNHATLGQVASAIGAALSAHGLSAAWKTEQNGQVVVTCTITHEQGHSESTSLTAAADTSGSKNAIQAIGSTITYLQRYTLLALTGIAAKGQDDDGKDPEPPEYITDKQLSQIVDMANESGTDADKFLKFMEVGSLEQIQASQFKKAMSALKTKLKAKQKADKEGSDGNN